MDLETDLSEQPNRVRSIEENRLYHSRYLRAINSPIRREILRFLQEGCSTVEDLHLKTGLSKSKLKWHLDILEYGSCVQRHMKQGQLVYKLTQEGQVIDYL